MSLYSFCVWLTGGKPSGREVKERRAKLQLLLEDGFEFKEGSEVKVQSVLAYVGVDDESQKLVSRSLKEIFPGVHSHDAFNVHTTTKHSEQDPFPDQIKATNFILQQKFLKSDKARKNVESSMTHRKDLSQIPTSMLMQQARKKFRKLLTENCFLFMAF